MRPAISIIFLTTLIGAGQGLFLALYTGQVYSTFKVLPIQDPLQFYALGSLFALGLLVLGLFSSFFHLGRPERAWRAASQWRTSWMSREVIVLPAFMASVAAWGLIHFSGWNPTLFVIRDAFNVDLALSRPVSKRLKSGQRGRAFFAASRQSLGGYWFVSVEDWLRKKVEIATQTAAF